MQSICPQCGNLIPPDNLTCSQCQSALVTARSEFDLSTPSAYVPAPYTTWQPPPSAASNGRWLKMAGSVAGACFLLLLYLGLQSYVSRPVLEDSPSTLFVPDTSTAEMDRQRIGTNGMLRLDGPMVPGGPTFGESKWADLEIAEFGWNFYAISEPPHRASCPYVTIRNKSKRTWNDVRVQVVITYADGRRTPTEISVGKLAPQRQHQAEGAIVGHGEKYSSVVGITGKQSAK